MVDQPEYGTNTPYLVDFIKITLSAKLLDVEEIRSLYLEKGLSMAQIARQCGIAKSVIVSRLAMLGISGAPISNRMTNPKNYRCPVAPYGYQAQEGRICRCSHQKGSQTIT